MKKLIRQYQDLAGGFGGMLFIAILGLSVLIFGGILVNAREVADLRDSIRDLELAHQQQQSLKPLAAVVAARQTEMRSRAIRTTSPQNLPLSDLPRLPSLFEAMSESASVRLLSARHLIEPGHSANSSLRMELRVVGEFAAFRSFLEELLGWEYQTVIEGFTLRSADGTKELQIIIQLPVS